LRMHVAPLFHQFWKAGACGIAWSSSPAKSLKLRITKPEIGPQTGHCVANSARGPSASTMSVVFLQLGHKMFACMAGSVSWLEILPLRVREAKRVVGSCARGCDSLHTEFLP
jgi:hypothetical protein